MYQKSLKQAFRKDREAIFKQLYLTAFPKVARMVKTKGGNLSDAQDIFQDALVIFHEKTMQDKLDIKVSAEAYLLGISKHLWNRQFSRQLPQVSLSSIDQQIQIPADYFQPQLKRFRLWRFIEKAGEKCLKLLRAFYYQNLTMQEIADEFSYSSVRSATVQKYKCMEKVRTAVKEKKLSYEESFA
jgi:DNA-directed RNA polymerase specialized sigma24 family protein